MSGSVKVSPSRQLARYSRSSDAPTSPTVSATRTTTFVGQALLWTLEKALGRAFTPELRHAWTTVYTLVATTMQEAASEVAVPVYARA